MRRTTRWFGMLSLAFLTASSVPARAADIETFFPKDTDVVISFNLEQILSSDLIKKYAIDSIKETLKNNTQVKDILTALGVDPLKDFTRVHIAGGLNPAEQKSLIVIEGKFDAKKINTTVEEFLKNSGDVSVEKVGGKNAYKFTPPNSPTAMYGMVVDSNYLVIGTDKTYLEGSIEAVGGKRKSELPKEVATLLSKADPKASMYMVANTKGKLDKLPLPGGNAQLLEAIEFFAAELRVEKDAKFNLAIGTADEDTSKQMSEQITNGLNLAKAFLPQLLPQDPRLKPLTKVVGGIKTTQKGKLITLSADVPADVIESLISASKDK